eukprot:1152437-Prorocentrum_minimum.AAC.1
MEGGREADSGPNQRMEGGREADSGPNQGMEGLVQGSAAALHRGAGGAHRALLPHTTPRNLQPPPVASLRGLNSRLEDVDGVH